MTTRKKNNSQRSAEQPTVDADLAVFARNDLTRSLVKAAMKPHPRLKIASGEIMPVVVMQGYEWENTIEILEYDSFGIATVIAPNANDGGRVGIFANRMQYPIRTISDFTQITWLEIQQAKNRGTNISSRYATALVHGMDKKINSVGYYGDTDYGLQGLLTSQLGRVNFSTPLALAPSPDAMLAMLTNIVSLPIANSNSLWTPKILVMPEAPHQILGSTMRAGSDKTILSQFLENQAAMGQIEEIIVDNSLVGKGENGTDAMLVLPYDREPDSDDYDIDETEDDDALKYPIFFAIAKEMEIPDEFQQWTDMMYQERAIARIGGVIVTDPTCGVIASNV
jgi:hypothetical protein